MLRKEKLFPTDKIPGITDIEVSVFYSTGGYSYLSGESCERGYYIGVVPTTKQGDGCFLTEFFKGYKKLLFSVNRASKKQDAIALDLFEKQAEVEAGHYIDLCVAAGRTV